jgi:hypothetical protein
MPETFHQRLRTLYLLPNPEFEISSMARTLQLVDVRAPDRPAPARPPGRLGLPGPCLGIGELRQR